MGRVLQASAPAVRETFSASVSCARSASGVVSGISPMVDGAALCQTGGVTTDTLPSVSIVIPAYNEEAGIRHCLVAAIEQTVPASEIIVVDNRSTDGTKAAVEAMRAAFPDAGIRLIEQNEEQGITPTRNAGFDAATGTVIGRIDADSALSPDWVEQVQLAFSAG